MPNIDLVVTDLDGTLWDAQERIHELTLDALTTLEQRRTPLLVATGRRRRSAQDALARQGLRPPAVLLDGALGHDLDTGDRFHRAPFDTDAAADVLNAFAAEGLSPCLYVDRDDADVIVGPTPSTHPQHLAHLGTWAVPQDPWEAVAEHQILGIGVVGQQRVPLERVAQQVGTRGEAAVVRDLYFGGATLIVRPPGISKWQGVEAFCRARGIDASNVLAVGDGENDLELLTNARVACVVSDGCEPALALADHVLDPAAAGGWAAILELA